MKGKITTLQKRKIYTMTHEMTDVQFKAIVDSTSYNSRQVIQKNKKNYQQSKEQMIAGLNKRTASEIITILEHRRSPEVVEAYQWLARNEHKLQEPAMQHKGMD